MRKKSRGENETGRGCLGRIGQVLYSPVSRPVPKYGRSNGTEYLSRPHYHRGDPLYSHRSPLLKNPKRGWKMEEFHHFCSFFLYLLLVNKNNDELHETQSLNYSKSN